MLEPGVIAVRLPYGFEVGPSGPPGRLELLTPQPGGHPGARATHRLGGPSPPPGRTSTDARAAPMLADREPQHVHVPASQAP